MTETAGAPSLRHNLVYAASGRVVFTLSQFAIILVVARLGTPEHVGALTLASALVTPLFFLTSMGMRDVHVVDDLDRFTRADYVAVRMFGGFFAITLSLVIVFTYSASSGVMVQSAIIGMAAVRFFAAQSTLNHGMFQRAERLDYVALSNLARGGLGLVAFGGVYWTTRDLPMALAGQAVAWLATNVLVDRVLLSWLGSRTGLVELRAVNIHNAARLIWWALPVGVALLLSRFAFSAPPIVLERYVGLATVGVFGVMFYMHTALSMVTVSIGGAASARLRRLYRTDQGPAFLRLTLKLLTLSIFVGASALVMAWLVGAPVMGLIFGPEYRDRELLSIIVLASAIGIAGAPLTTALTAAQAFRRRLAISAIGCVVGFAASILLIPNFGVFGAAWVLVAITAIQVLLSAISFLTIIGAAEVQKDRGSSQ